MTLIKCPKCNRIFPVAPHSGDVVHTCDSGNPTLDQEDIKVVGGWTDYTGSDYNNQTAASTNTQGIENEFWGTRAAIINRERKQSLTTRGNSKALFRTRQHEESISQDYIESTEGL